MNTLNASTTAVTGFSSSDPRLARAGGSPSLANKVVNQVDSTADAEQQATKQGETQKPSSALHGVRTEGLELDQATIELLDAARDSDSKLQSRSYQQDSQLNQQLNQQESPSSGSDVSTGSAPLVNAAIPLTNNRDMLAGEGQLSREPDNTEPDSTIGKEQISRQNLYAVSSYQSVNLLAQRESVQKMLGVDLFA